MLKKTSAYLDTININISVDMVPDPKKFIMHTHRRYELYFFVGGIASFYVEGRNYPLKNGDIMVMNSTESHCIAVAPDAPYERYVIHFEREAITSVDPTGELLAVFENRGLGEFNQYRRKDFDSGNYLIFLENIFKDSPNRELQIKTNLFALLNELNNAFRYKKKSEVPDNETQIQQIIRFINNNLGGSLSLEELCSTFYLSKPQLCKSFKEHTGCTVWNYITTKRMLAAQKEIENGLSATKIYSNYGYSDYSAFYRAYKKFFGCSPKGIS